MDKIEKWKPIVGYEGLYEVSDIGNIKSLPRMTGNQYSNGMIRKCQINKYGYPIITLVKNNTTKTFTVHRLVATAFIPNPKSLPQINHINGNKIDNSVDNLEWCNGFENQSHRFKVLGHVTHNRQLTKEEVFEILSKSGKGWRKDIAEKLGVTEACIKAVRSGNNYKEWFNEYMGLSVDDLVSYGWIRLKGIDDEA